MWRAIIEDACRMVWFLFASYTLFDLAFVCFCVFWGRSCRWVVWDVLLQDIQLLCFVISTGAKALLAGVLPFLQKINK